MKQTKSFLPSRFQTLRDTQPVPTTWEAIVGEIKGTAHRNATLLYRETLTRLHEAEESQDIQQAEPLKRQKERLKAELPAFIPSVTLQGGRSARHIVNYLPYVLVDIDNIAPDLFGGLLRQIREDRHSFLVYVTVSGRGIRIVARTAEGLNRTNFLDTWQSVNEYYARLAGMDVDEHCKNATRMSAICHDPEVLYRPDAEPFEVCNPVATRRRSAVGRKATALHAASTVRRLVEEAGGRYEPHRHNDYISRCLYWMNRFGIPQAEAEQWALAEFADYEADTHSVSSIVNSCYALTDEHGAESLSRYRISRDRTAAADRPAKATVEEMENYLNTRVELRMNAMTRHLEYRMKPVTDDVDWQPMADQVENTLWCDMQRAGLNVDIRQMRTLLLSNYVKDYHPLKQYLDSLAPWDGTTDYIGQTAARIRTANLSADVFRTYFCRWLVGMLAGALSDRVVNHVILVLLGEQGRFKTSFAENLLPPCLRSYYASKTNSQRLSKDDLFSMTENLIINFEEIDSMQRTELNQLKAMTTTLFVNERPAYGRHKMRVPHIASFLATGNNLQFLTDDTGSRRWLVAEVSDIDNPWENPLPYDGLYAQAKALLDSGYRYWFDHDEIETLNLRNRRFEVPNPARELLLTYYRRPTSLEKGHYYTASQIVARFGRSIAINQIQIGRCLKELGYEMIHTRHGNFWLMLERSCDEMQAVLPEAAEEEEPL